MTTAPSTGTSEKQSRDWAMYVHLSSLSMFIVPFGDVLGPLVLWTLKKNDSPIVDRHGKAALNFHLSLWLYGAVAVTAFFLLAIVTLGIGVILMIPLIIFGAIAFGVLLLVFPILAALKAQNGEEYTYPVTIAFLK